MTNKIYHYFVEGQDEQKIINTLKTDCKLIEPGKVDIFNVVQNKIKKNHIMSLKPNTIAILVFDTDTQETDTLLENIKFLKKQPNIKTVLCIPQVNNLEDELIRSCDIKQIKELTNSKSNSEYKHDLIQNKNLKNSLMQHKFDIVKFWSQSPNTPFDKISNDAKKIKK